MPISEGVFFVPEMSPDTRIRVFRRSLNLPGEFDEMEVDAYVIVTERFLVFLDTMLCPEDMAVVMQHVQNELPGRQLLVVNSHADWDHSWGNCYFTGPILTMPHPSSHKTIVMFACNQTSHIRD